jgi:cobalt-precorrin 5A hydrolase / precorrin-3B C17-methyltransferase
MVKPVIFVLGISALPLAQKIKNHLGGQIRGPEGLEGCDAHFEKAAHSMAAAFNDSNAIIGLCASGILIRALAPRLRNKTSEPAVVAVAEDGSSVVPLLGGHHGANDLARRIATLTGGHAAITTASDVRLGESFDEPGESMVLANPEDTKSATAARLRGEDVRQEVTIYRKKGGPSHLVYHPRVLTVGIGCERGTDPAEVRQLIADTLEKHNIAEQSVFRYASIDLKEDEPAIHQFEPVQFFTAEELKAQSHRIQNPSGIVEQETGTPSVAEAAALALIGEQAELIVPKTKSKRATIAIAKAPQAYFRPNGRWRGTLYVIGVGPGNKETLTPDADFSLWDSSEWVGYSLYLDLVENLRNGQTRHDFPLGAEEDRVRHAIALAKRGKRVALVCSGDAGIYAMAALVYEIIDLEPCRIEVNVIPGISAFQAAAAKAGAMIGHDFCCISLSDLLTPWEVIEKRVKTAAEGDFVISFYNPRSLKRRDRLERAFAILAEHRPKDTPVIIATNLGRPEEKVKIVPFSEFNPDDAGMLTLVMVGSSQSKSFTRGDGRTYAYTPRGYAKNRTPA